MGFRFYAPTPPTERGLQTTQYILGAGGRNITSLMKLMTYAQARHLVTYGAALFQDAICAWPYGPALPAIWEHVVYKRGGVTLNVSQKEADTLERTLATYGRMSAGQLTRLSHSEKPWLDARKGLGKLARTNRIIEPEALLAFYSQSGRLL